MEFALLFYNAPESNIPAAEREATLGATLAEMSKWIDAMRRAGVHKTGVRLAGVDGASSIRASGGDVVVTDGPFAETKEILGGLVLIDCSSREEALGWARRCPIAKIGTVELRPQYSAANAR